MIEEEKTDSLWFFNDVDKFACWYMFTVLDVQKDMNSHKNRNMYVIGKHENNYTSKNLLISNDVVKNISYSEGTNSRASDVLTRHLFSLHHIHKALQLTLTSS
jgi:hypothetical protein